MSAPNPERLLALLQQFINAPSWGQSRRFVEQYPELLTPEADALLGRLLEQYRNDPRASQILSEHRDLLRRCREEGLKAAFASLENGDADPEAALRALLEQAETDPEARAVLEAMQRQMEEHPLLQAVQTLSEARSTKEVLEVVQAHPALLGDKADRMLRQSIENARRVGQVGMARHIEERYQVLRQIREQGIDQQQLRALAEAQEQMAAALAGLPEHLQQVLADVSSQEELEVALKEHPELAEALAQAAATAGPAGQPALVETIYQFINAEAWIDSMRVVQEHPELLADEADEVLDQMIAAQDDEDAVRILEEHRELLRRCRESGVKAAFAEKMGLPEGVDPLEAAAALRQAQDAAAQAQAALPEDVRRELAELIEREGITSQEELEAALKEHPELREAVEAAAQHTAPPSREAISYAAPWPHTRPACGQTWKPDVWQIVDAEEHPDLVGHIHDSTLHSLTCPACGESSEAAAPLMYHDQGKGQLLLAVPEAWGSERGEQENRRLFPLLRAGLGIKGYFIEP